MIQLNNGRKMKLEILEDKEQFLVISIFDEKGELEQKRTIKPEELVLLYDYYIMKKEKGEQLL